MNSPPASASGEVTGGGAENIQKRHSIHVASFGSNIAL